MEKIESYIKAGINRISIGLQTCNYNLLKMIGRIHTFEEFLTKLKRMRIDVYDTYEGDKGDEFKTWLENEWSNLK